LKLLGVAEGGVVRWAPPGDRSLCSPCSDGMAAG
jgi:hypothetical protein